MTDNVVTINGQPLADPREPDPEVVKFAERMLEMARSGEMRAISAAWENADLSIGYKRAGPACTKLVGAIGRLQFEVIKDLYDA